MIFLTDRHNILQGSQDACLAEHPNVIPRHVMLYDRNHLLRYLTQVLLSQIHSQFECEICTSRLAVQRPLGVCSCVIHRFLKHFNAFSRRFDRILFSQSLPHIILREIHILGRDLMVRWIHAMAFVSAGSRTVTTVLLALYEELRAFCRRTSVKSSIDTFVQRGYAQRRSRDWIETLSEKNAKWRSRRTADCLKGCDSTLKADSLRRCLGDHLVNQGHKNTSCIIVINISIFVRGSCMILFVEKGEVGLASW